MQILLQFACSCRGPTTGLQTIRCLRLWVNQNADMTEDTAQKMLRDAGNEAIRTSAQVIVVGHRLNVLVAPNPRGGIPRALFYVDGRDVSMAAAAAAIAESFERTA